eukprot:g15613.t1
MIVTFYEHAAFRSYVLLKFMPSALEKISVVRCTTCNKHDPSRRSLTSAWRTQRHSSSLLASNSPTHLGRDYTADLRHDFNILTTPNSRTDSVASAKGALRLIKQVLTFSGQPEVENKFYRCEVVDQYTTQKRVSSVKEWVKKCLAREMRKDKTHIQTFETAQLVLCVMSVLCMLCFLVLTDLFLWMKRFRKSEMHQFSCTLATFPYGRRKKESERRREIRVCRCGRREEASEKVVYGIEDVGSTMLIFSEGEFESVCQAMCSRHQAQNQNPHSHPTSTTIFRTCLFCK